MNFIEFEKKDLLNSDDLELLIISKDPCDKAEIIKKKLLNYVLITEDKEYYAFDIKNVLYHKEKYTEEKILTIVSLLISKSLKEINKKDRELIELKYAKTYDNIFKNVNIQSYIPQLKTFLSNANKINFRDPQLDTIHFKNGYYDFTTGKFQKREVNKHFISNFINRNYKRPTQEHIDKVYKDLNKIYPKKDVRDYLIMTYGMGLTGQSCEEQKILYLLGLGSTGKSTMLELLKLSVPSYIFTLPKQTFSKNYTKRDKVFNTFAMQPHIRIGFINEPEDTRMDETVFKDFIDGNVQTTTLYTDGSNDFKHHAKIILAGNTVASIIIDTGTTRRFDTYTHTSQFVKEDRKAEVDESKHIYLANLKLLKDAENDDDYLNALFTIVAEYGHNWRTGKKIYQSTEEFSTAKNELIGANDIIQDFIDKTLIKTNSEDDRIGKEEMHNLFKNTYPNKHLSPIQLFNSLKQKSLEYKCDLRVNRVKGCYIKLKLKDDNDDNNDDNEEENKINEDPLEKQVLALNEIIKKQTEEIELLRNQIKDRTEIKQEDKKEDTEIKQADVVDVVNHHIKTKKIMTTKKLRINPLDAGIEMIPETKTDVEDKKDNIYINKDDDEIDDDELNDIMLETKKVKPKYKFKSKSTFSLTKD